MRERLLLGPVLIAVLVAIAWLDEWSSVHGLPNGSILFVCMVLIALMGAGELRTILLAKSVEVAPWVLQVAAAAGLAVCWLAPRLHDGLYSTALVGAAGVGVLGVSMLWALRKKAAQGVIGVCGGALLSFVYLGLMFGFVLLFRHAHSTWALLWVLLVIKSCDIGAYFTGKAVGKHKLIPWLSPGKTWEGLVGGIVLAVIVAVLGLMGFRSALGYALAPLWFGAAAGVVFSVLGQAGDLMASAFKRDAGLKDSGHALPGFGGVLDVIDSPLLVVPVAFWGLRLVEWLAGATG